MLDSMLSSLSTFSSTTIYASVKLWCSLRAQLKEVPVPARCSDPTLARRIQLPWELTMVSKFYYETRSSPSSGLTMLIVEIYLGPLNKMFEINLPEPFHCVHPGPCEQGWSLKINYINKYSRHGLHHHKKVSTKKFTSIIIDCWYEIISTDWLDAAAAFG